MGNHSDVFVQLRRLARLAAPSGSCFADDTTVAPADGSFAPTGKSALVSTENGSHALVSCAANKQK